MRASRLVQLLLVLQTRGQLTAGELAEVLEVSVRTVHRDVEALSEAGVPIYAERGPHGGIRLVDGYRTRLTGMTGDEAEALFLSGLPGPAAELGLGTVVAAARLKVLAALPPELRTRASRLVERFHLDASGWFQAGEPVPHLAVLSEAVWETHQVTVDYGRGDKTVERILEPLGLVLKAGVWYVVAAIDGSIRTYRVGRVSAATMLEARFERPEGFDLAAWWSESSAAYEREADRVDVTIRIRPDRIDWLRRAVGDRAVDAAVDLPTQDPVGWRHLLIRLDWPDEVPGQLLAVGPNAEVLDPPEIRDRLIAMARATLDGYGPGIDRVSSPEATQAPGEGRG
jgi:predicted DNA-binding transcriptional regulator YafY